MDILSALRKVTTSIKTWADSKLETKLNKNLGKDNAGKVLAIGDDGDVELQILDIGIIVLSGTDDNPINIDEIKTSGTYLIKGVVTTSMDTTSGSDSAKLNKIFMDGFVCGELMSVYSLQDGFINQFMMNPTRPLARLDSGTGYSDAIDVSYIQPVTKTAEMTQPVGMRRDGQLFTKPYMIKHDTEDNWLKNVSFIPEKGEIIIYDVDNTHTYERVKIGDGVTNINDLIFFKQFTEGLEIVPINNLGNYKGEGISEALVTDTIFAINLDKYIDCNNVAFYNPTETFTISIYFNSVLQANILFSKCTLLSISNDIGFKTIVVSNGSDYLNIAYDDDGKFVSIRNRKNATVEDVNKRVKISQGAINAGKVIAVDASGNISPSNTHTIDNDGNSWFAGNVKVGGTGQDDSNAKQLATLNDIESQVASLVNSAPETLDTLNELAEALGNDPNFATTVAAEIGKKVDKVDGKGLSTNDYTNEEKEKLNNVSSSDWNQSDKTSLDYIKNRTHYTTIEKQENELGMFEDSNIAVTQMSDGNLGTCALDTSAWTEDVDNADRIAFVYESPTQMIYVKCNWINAGWWKDETSGITIEDYVVGVDRKYIVTNLPVGAVGENTNHISLTFSKTTDIEVVTQLDEKYIPNTIVRTSEMQTIKPKSTTITLPAANWTGDTNPYSQEVTISGITANSKVDLQPTAAQIIELQNADIALMAENSEGTVTVYSIGGKPTSDYTIQVLITEVTSV